MSDNSAENVGEREPRLTAQDIDRDNQPAANRCEGQPIERVGLPENARAEPNVEQRGFQQNLTADKAVVAEMRQKTRRSFIVGGAAALAALTGWRWLRTRREADGLPWPLRLSHEFNEQVSRDYFSLNRLATTFPVEMASEPRVNGSYGLDEEDFDPAGWKLAIVGVANPPESDSDISTNTEPDLSLTLAEIKQLPRVEMVTELKCIEGWSVIVRWAGARLADLIAKYPPLTRSGSDPDVMRRPDDLVGYVRLETPDSEYYVGLDLESALHPQTLLCYEMNGQPLSLKHGAPLRLVIPVKYGIKNIKRIGKITYTDKRPADYWAERGYDWYSGH
ncbi:MAG TPA: molybdopterin-dependent oxidoreductase [Pyrinomonadaceae bacterium]|nr:molybdopterin-dependent oxidoreductase [Pyrinomonadaceae bacterium]